MTRHLFPAHWGKAQGVFSHKVSGVDYGPSLPGETLPAYKERVRGAYGSLRGVSFHDLREAAQ